MTEEIIRNGVKIERCRFSELLYGGVCCIKSGLHEACNDNPECEYKQLKRLEQEREQLKKQNEILLGQLVINDGEDVTVQISQSQFDEYNELKQENKELKKQIESQKGLITVGGKAQYKYLQEIDKLQQENKELKALNKKICEDWEKEIKVYWNILEEIREVAKFAQNLPCGDISDCDNCDDEITNNGQFCMHKRIEEIKTKIEEVLNDSKS